MSRSSVFPQQDPRLPLFAIPGTSTESVGKKREWTCAKHGLEYDDRRRSRATFRPLTFPEGTLLHRIHRGSGCSQRRIVAWVREVEPIQSQHSCDGFGSQAKPSNTGNAGGRSLVRPSHFIQSHRPPPIPETTDVTSTGRFAEPSDESLNKEVSGSPPKIRPVQAL
jgi:hypothetical protein